ncbi:MAG TPA: hypothetical protein VGF24_14540 [Vicinamibacterales bacterium]|jgi:hypothetical protein
MVGFLFWLLTLVPASLFALLLYAYTRRFSHRKELIRSLLTNSNAIGKYSVAFRASVDMRSEEWRRRLDLDIEAYLYPIALSTVLTFGAMVVLISKYSQNALGLPQPLLLFVQQTPTAALAGFAGAYLWSLYDFTDRFRILNLPINALHGMWFRMALTPIVACFAQALIKDTFVPMLGFGIGMLPVATVMSWVQDTARQRINVNAGKEVEPLWEHIQGLTPDIIARLIEASVTSAAHLANQDPVSLLRRTNIEWRNVLDMMDQAILLTYVGPALEKLRPMGIRGAIEAAILYGRFKTSAGDTEALQSIEAFAGAIGVKPDVARNLLHNLFEDPQVDLIWSLWFDRAAVPSPKDQEVNPEQVKAPEALPAPQPPLILTQPAAQPGGSIG